MQPPTAATLVKSLQQNACEYVSYPPVKPTYFRWGKENHFPKHQAVGDMLVMRLDMVNTWVCIKTRDLPNPAGFPMLHGLFRGAMGGGRIFKGFQKKLF